MQLELADVLTILAVGLTFATVLLASLAIVGAVERRRSARRVDRILGPERRPTRSSMGLRRETERLQRVVDALSRLSLPEGGWSGSALRLRFIRAGFRGEGTPRIYYAVKSLLTLVVPAMVGGVLLKFSAGTPPAKAGMITVMLAAAGYYLPDLFLRWRTERRMSEMRNVLPDLIDLLLVCVESGLGLDAAMNRVSKEIARSSVVLSEEFYLAGLEMRAGGGRVDALRHMAERIGLEDLDNLVSMLVQADRFGTSLGDALRIQSEVMRVKRMQRAEEMAAKIPVKILFPLMACVFPALLAVLLGPAAIQMMDVFGK